MTSTVYSCADCGFRFTVNKDEQAEALGCAVCLELVMPWMTISMATRLMTTETRRTRTVMRMKTPSAGAA